MLEEKENIEKIIEYIKELEIDFLLSYSLKSKSNLIIKTKDLPDRDVIYDCFEKKLEIVNIDELPLLIYNHNIEGNDF